MIYFYNNTAKGVTMSEKTVDVNEENFETSVLESNLPVVVDFWAEWCGPCKMLTPTIESVADDYEGKSLIVKVNIDDAPQIAQKYGIRSIPSLLFFNNGSVMDQRVGAVSYEEIANILDKLIEG